MVTVYEQRGIEQGKRNLLLQLLRKKFGNLPTELEIVGKIDLPEQLDTLSLAVLDSHSVNEFLEFLRTLGE